MKDMDELDRIYWLGLGAFVVLIVIQFCRIEKVNVQSYRDTTAKKIGVWIEVHY